MGALVSSDVNARCHACHPHQEAPNVAVAREVPDAQITSRSLEVELSVHQNGYFCSKES